MTVTDTEAVNMPEERRFQRFSWSSIFAGLLLAVASMVVLSELMAALGLLAVRPASGDAPQASTLVAAGAIAWVITSIIALFVGGWGAAYIDRHSYRQSRSNGNGDGALHGAVVWSLATIVIIMTAGTLLGGTIGGVLSLGKGVASAAGSAVSNVGGGIGEAAQSIAQQVRPEFNWDTIRNQAENLFARANAQQGSARSNSSSVDPLAQIARYFGNLNAQHTDADRQELISSIAINAGISPQDATLQVERWENAAAAAKQEYEQRVAQFQRQTRETAEEAAKKASLAAFYALAATLLGLSAAVLGGYLGGKPRQRSPRTPEPKFVPHPA